jgi:hypothetical protein
MAQSYREKRDPPTCWHCRKPIARCDSLPSHIGCSSGHGWIHTNPEQWGHDCEPRSGPPYARPDAQVTP